MEYLLIDYILEASTCAYLSIDTFAHQTIEQSLYSLFAMGRTYLLCSSTVQLSCVSFLMKLLLWLSKEVLER